MLQEFVKAQPFLSIIVFSLIITILSTFAYKKLTNQARLKELREKQIELQKKMKEYKADAGKMMEIQKESFQLQAEQMKHNMKPMLFTFIPFLLVLGLLRNLYIGAGDMIIHWTKNVWLFHTGFGWVEWYIFSSIFFSIILRKILKIY